MHGDYDAIIIGAGMSGLATAIRLAMFDKKVIVLEKHIISGGLNSYYQRRVPGSKELLKFDVGLHALTNFARKGERKRPLTKLLKQLRIPHDQLKLKEQTHSLIKFGATELKFSNDFQLLLSEIELNFPNERDHFLKLLGKIESFNELDLSSTYIPSRQILSQYIKEPLLVEMILAPLLIYGSSWENDMDFSQFVIMFKSIYLEGFSRPEGGVRTILDLLKDKLSSCGGEVRFNAEVVGIETKGDTHEVILKKGETLRAKKIFSSMGLPETYNILNDNRNDQYIGNLSFTEALIVNDDKSFLENFTPTIVFYNKTDSYSYESPSSLIDQDSAVICFPDNYERDNTNGRGLVRVTNIANNDQWCSLHKKDYLANKEKVYNGALSLSQNLIGKKLNPIYQDVFTPKTITRYTNHFSGAVYGSTLKKKDGRTDYPGVYIIGTDQGFLGIVGAMLSGISMANLHGLMDE